MPTRKTESVQRWEGMGTLRLTRKNGPASVDIELWLEVLQEYLDTGRGEWVDGLSRWTGEVYGSLTGLSYSEGQDELELVIGSQTGRVRLSLALDGKSARIVNLSGIDPSELPS